jgi:hypothetical protein
MDLREASTTTIDERGASHVSVRAVKSAPKRVTLLLAVAFDGTYLPPMIVFTGKPGGAVERELAAMDGPNLHAVQDKGWTDQVIMNRWISEVLGPFLASRRLGYTGPAIDILDNFSVHASGKTRAALQEVLAQPMMLPPNTTSHTQPLDVGLNKPFKDGMAALLDDFLAVPGNEDVAVSREMLSAWVGEVWRDMEARLDLDETLGYIGYIPRANE